MIMGFLIILHYNILLRYVGMFKYDKYVYKTSLKYYSLKFDTWKLRVWYELSSSQCSKTDFNIMYMKSIKKSAIFPLFNFM